MPGVLTHSDKQVIAPGPPVKTVKMPISAGFYQDNEAPQHVYYIDRPHILKPGDKVTVLTGSISQSGFHPAGSYEVGYDELKTSGYYGPTWTDWYHGSTPPSEVVTEKPGPGIPTVQHNDFMSLGQREIGMYKSSLRDPVLRALKGQDVPPPPLVGVEPNPGPKQKIKAKASKRKGPMIANARPAPVAMDYKFINSNKMKNTVIKHVEQIIEVAGSTNSYNLALSLNLNPGLAQTFPWLSQAAQQYEAYIFKSIKFIFMPYVSSATSGYVAMNCDYNPQDDDVVEFTTKQAFTDYDGAVQGNSWEAMVFNVKCPNPEGPKRRSMRYGTLPSPYDLHNYDHATFNLAVGGQASTANIGTLFVHYVVELARPRIAAVSGNTGFARYNGGGTFGLYSQFGTTPTSTADNIPVSISGNVVTVNRVGRYMISGWVDGTGLTGQSTASNLFVPGTNCSVVRSNISIANTAGTQVATRDITFDITAIGGSFTFSPCNTITTITSSNFAINQIPSGLSISPKSQLENKLDFLVEKVKQLEEEKKEHESVLERYYSSASSSVTTSSVATPTSDWDTISRKSRR